MSRKLNLILIIFFSIVLICALICLFAFLFPSDHIEVKKSWNPDNINEYYKLSVGYDIPSGDYTLTHSSGNNINDTVFIVCISDTNYTEFEDIPVENYEYIIGGYGNATSCNLKLSNGDYIYIIYTKGENGKILIENN